MSEENIREQIINTKAQTADENAINLVDILERFVESDFSSASDLTDVDEIIKMLKTFYGKEKRHLYSEIFIFLSERHKWWKEENDDIIRRLETIDNNVKYIGDKIKNDSEIGIQFTKLKDHICLETARIKFWYNQQSVLKTQISELNSGLNQAQQEAKEIEGLNEKTREEVNGFRTTQVTILTIFIGILLTLVSDIKFSAAILEIADKTPLYKLCLIIIIGSAAVINTSFLLVSLLAKLTGKSLAIDCSEYKCRDSSISSVYKKACGECTGKCCFPVRFWRRYTYIPILNIIFVVIVGLLIAFKDIELLNK